MIFLDSNVPMYLIGQKHPNKSRGRALLEQLVNARERLVTDAEVFQEILHRYIAIKRRDAIGPAWRLLRRLSDEVFPIDFELVDQARRTLEEHENLSARDALHIAAMRRHQVEQVLSFDAGFDGIPGVRRLS